MKPKEIYFEIVMLSLVCILINSITYLSFLIGNEFKNMVSWGDGLTAYSVFFFFINAIYVGGMSSSILANRNKNGKSNS